MAKTSKILESVGHELKVNPPRVLAKTKAKFGAARAEAQRKAILLSKARERGAHVPMPSHHQKMERMKAKMKQL